MKNMYLNKAMSEGLCEEMARDKNVILIGEDIINRGGGMSNFLTVPKMFPERCFDMPIAELGYSNFGVGASMAGLRPVVDLMFSDFGTLAAGAIINGAAKYRFFALGELQCPVVFTFANGGKATFGGVGSGANHSECMEGIFQNVPGLKIVAPYYSGDAKGLLKASIRDNDPVLFFYHEGSLGKKSEVPEDEDYVIPLTNAAKVLREGTDVTIVAIQSMVPNALKAADILAGQGISAEIIDPRVLIPLDEEGIARSVRKTGRLIVTQEAPSRGGFCNEIITTVTSRAFDQMKAPAVRLGAYNTPIASGYIEKDMMPDPEKIAAAAVEICKK